MADDQEIVIVDGDGTEHVFPAGFDPKRAAAIVKQRRSGVPNATAADMLSRRGFGVSSEIDPADHPEQQGLLDRLIAMLKPVAHPTSAADLAPLLLPARADITAATR